MQLGLIAHDDQLKRDDALAGDRRLDEQPPIELECEPALPPPLPDTLRRLESLDSFKKFASEDARIIGTLTPTLINAIGGTRRASR